MAIEYGLPDDFKEMVEMVRVCKALNQIMHTSHYTPQTLKQMEQRELDHLLLAVQVIN